MTPSVETGYDHSVEVIVPGGRTANSLGVVRGLGRRGIPVAYIVSRPRSYVGHSRYIRRRLTCQTPAESESGFVEALLNLGRRNGRKAVIMPTGDRDVLAVSKHQRELREFFLLPVPGYETVRSLVDKRRFYELLSDMGVPHPRTYFPESLSELRSMDGRIERPYIIKPVHTLSFQDEFGPKCFVIRSAEECELAVSRLQGKNVEVLVQEIVPGTSIYMAYMYFNRESRRLGACGYDKLRQFPPRFGSGSLCRSNWRPEPIDTATRLLTAMGYHGIAEPEFKLDPRDGGYKLLEVNARTSSENRLSAACGVDIEYIAYLDATGQDVGDSPAARDNVLWVDDFYDGLSCWKQLRKGELGVRDIVRSLKGGKVHSVAAWDDIMPVIRWPFDIASIRYNLALDKPWISRS